MTNRLGGSLISTLWLLIAASSCASRGSTPQPDATQSDGYLYMIGGENANGPIGAIERAVIQADGSLGGFAALPATSGLGISRVRPAIVVVHNWLYALGGASSVADPAGLTSVERAPVDAAGSIGAFVPSGPLAVRRAGHASAVVDGSVYILGGQASPGLVERAWIGADGTLGAFALVPGVDLEVPRDRHTVAVAGSALFVIGGVAAFAPQGSDPVTASIEQMVIYGGELVRPSFASHLVIPRHSATSVAIGNYVYVIGGAAGAPGFVENTVERAQLTPDQSGDFSRPRIGAFSIVRATLVTARYAHDSAVIGGYLYVFGGLDASGSALSSIERAPITAGGSLGTFAVVPDTALDRGVDGATLAVVVTR